MEHINDIELQEYVSGTLPETKAQQVRRHIDGCDACKGRYQDAVDLWNALGQWRVDSSGHEIADRIETLAAETPSNRRAGRAKIIQFTRSIPTALRVAAAIILAIGGGHLLGKYGQSPSTPDVTISQEGPRYVAALGFEWSSELTWTVLDEGTAQGEVNP
jgi:anti-sigma factor RsiW